MDRSSGLLLHISSLASAGEIGDLGPAAYAFADFLALAKQRLWQVLPLGPTGYGNSPYAGLSAFAGNPLFISLEGLADSGWIARDRLPVSNGPAGKVSFELAAGRKIPLLRAAARNFIARREAQEWSRFENFCRENAHWLEDYAAYCLLRDEFQMSSWRSWPEEYARRDPAALLRFRERRAEDLNIERAIQFAFDEQWNSLRRYCEPLGIRFIGDVAIFVNYDSADVWTHPDIFEMDEDLSPLRVAGVPPDYFSQTGQRWGNPLYRWELLESQGFDWWLDRIRRSLRLYDLIRLDHFRGFEAYWAIPAKDETAVNGSWMQAPGERLFSQLRERLGDLPFIAEDLGLITPQVEELRERFGFPGMRVLQFGFSDRGAHIYLPHRFCENTVVYTGTHDNDTTLGWWRHGAGPKDRAAVRAYLNPADGDLVWSMIRAAASSVAGICLFPVQDILDLGSEARMNTPATPENNWSWRLTPGVLTPELAKRLADLMEVTDRDGWKEDHPLATTGTAVATGA